MAIDLASNGLWLLAIALVASGFAMGFLSGLFGIGGGAILVPVLYEVFGALGVDKSILMHLCLGTALAVMVPTTITSFKSHRARGNVDMDYLRRIGPWIVAGVVLGALIARFAPSKTLMLIWAIAGAGLALKMAVGGDEWRLGPEIPRSWVTEVYAAFVGLISTPMSIGGASFMIAYMTLFGRPLLPSIATSSGIGPLIAVPGTLGFIWAGWGAAGAPPFSLGFVSLIGALLVTPVSVYAAPLGVKAAHGLPQRRLELYFAAFLGLMSAKFAWTYVWG
jgi:uncharacterized protein